MIFISGDNENKVIKGLNDVDEEMIVTDKPGVEPQLLPQRMDSWWLMSICYCFTSVTDTVAFSLQKSSSREQN